MRQLTPAGFKKLMKKYQRKYVLSRRIQLASDLIKSSGAWVRCLSLSDTLPKSRSPKNSCPWIAIAMRSSSFLLGVCTGFRPFIRDFGTGNRRLPVNDLILKSTNHFAGMFFHDIIFFNLIRSMHDFDV